MSSKFTASELDRLEGIAKAAAPRSWDEHREWRDEFGYNNGGTPSRFFYIPQHNGGAKVEMLAEVSEHLVAFQPKTALQLIDAARAYERLVSQDPWEALMNWVRDPNSTDVSRNVGPNLNPNDTQCSLIAEWEIAPERRQPGDDGAMSMIGTGKTFTEAARNLCLNLRLLV